MLDRLPPDLFHCKIIVHLTAQDCASLCLVNRTVRQMVMTMLQWKPALLWHHAVLSGTWEEQWKNVFAPQTMVDDLQLMYYLDHFPMSITRYQQTFIKAAQSGSRQALEHAWALWQRRQTPNEHLLILTVQVATRHACVHGRLNCLEWLLEELPDVVASHGVQDNWDMCCYNGTVDLIKLWMDKQNLGPPELRNRNWYPLMVAASSDKLAAIRYLLQRCSASAADVLVVLQHAYPSLILKNRVLSLQYLTIKAQVTDIEVFERTLAGTSHILLKCIQCQAVEALDFVMDHFSVTQAEFEANGAELMLLLVVLGNLALLKVVISRLGPMYSVWQAPVQPPDTTMPSRRMIEFLAHRSQTLQQPLLYQYVCDQLVDQLEAPGIVPGDHAAQATELDAVDELEAQAE
eukprot:m.109549 g.109549  ORF g.109549 m.109549 type:complete len:404 (-) comp15346_c0_seq20:50-1261(-)